MKFVYISTTGAGDPTRSSIGLHLAVNGALEEGHDVSVALVGDAAEIVLGDNPEKIEGVGVPPMRELLAKLKSSEATVYI